MMKAFKPLSTREDDESQRRIDQLLSKDEVHDTAKNAATQAYLLSRQQEEEQLQIARHKQLNLASSMPDPDSYFHDDGEHFERMESVTMGTDYASSRPAGWTYARTSQTRSAFAASAPVSDANEGADPSGNWLDTDPGAGALSAPDVDLARYIVSLTQCAASRAQGWEMFNAAPAAVQREVLAAFGGSLKWCN